MRLAKWFIALFLLVLSISPVMADPCAAVICLSTNKLAPQECKNDVDGYFSIRVYTVHCYKCSAVYDPPATAAKRYSDVMDQCTGARKVDKDNVNAMYGMLEYSPFDYTITGSDGKSAGYAAVSLTKGTETRYLTCSDAAGMPAYASMIQSPSPDALAIPDGWQASMGGTTVTAIGGYANWPLLDATGTFVQNGFIVETRSVTKTIGSGTVTDAGDWTASSSPNNCKISDPTIFSAPYVPPSDGWTD
jgi:hypothetical protein